MCQISIFENEKQKTEEIGDGSVVFCVRFNLWYVYIFLCILLRFVLAWIFFLFQKIDNSIRYPFFFKTFFLNLQVWVEIKKYSSIRKLFSKIVRNKGCRKKTQIHTHIYTHTQSQFSFVSFFLIRKIDQALKKGSQFSRFIWYFFFFLFPMH